MFCDVFVSPSGIVQVEEEAFIPKFGKNLIVMPVHVACNIGKKMLQKYIEQLQTVKVLVLMPIIDDSSR